MKPEPLVTLTKSEDGEHYIIRCFNSIGHRRPSNRVIMERWFLNNTTGTASFKITVTERAVLAMCRQCCASGRIELES